MFIDFFVVESASNPAGVGGECCVEVLEGSFVPRVGETCYLPVGLGASFVVQKVSTRWVRVSDDSWRYVPRVRVDLRN